MAGNIQTILKDPLLDLSPQATWDQIEFQTNSYLDLLVKWNQKINLTSEKSNEDILKRHIFDSLQYARVVPPDSRIMDIGSGAGFPGIPLKIVYPQLVAILVESQRKRCSFLEAVVRELNLKNIKIINERAEKLSPDPMGKIDIVLFRAVSDINSCLDLGVRFLAEKGKIILKKGPDEHIEVMQPLRGFSLDQEIIVTGLNQKRSSLLVFEKCFT